VVTAASLQPPGEATPGAVRLLGIEGSPSAGSSSASALRVALEGAAAAGAHVETVEVAALELPFFSPEAVRSAPEPARALADSVHSADALVLSSPLYHGSISGGFKNALDWLELLAHRDPPYLTGKVVGLIAPAGGTHGLQAINTLAFVVRSLRGWGVPLVVPAARSWRAFERRGGVRDEAVAGSLRALGAEVVRAAQQATRTGTCDYADDPRPGPEGARRGGAELSFGPLPGPGDSEGG
jgi:FMN reductase